MENWFCSNLNWDISLRRREIIPLTPHRFHIVSGTAVCSASTSHCNPLQVLWITLVSLGIFPGCFTPFVVILYILFLLALFLYSSYITVPRGSVCPLVITYRIILHYFETFLYILQEENGHQEKKNSLLVFPH